MSQRMNNFQEKVGFLWSVADLMRGDYKQSEFRKLLITMPPTRRGAYAGMTTWFTELSELLLPRP